MLEDVCLHFATAVNVLTDFRKVRRWLCCVGCKHGKHAITEIPVRQAVDLIEHMSDKSRASTDRPETWTPWSVLAPAKIEPAAHHHSNNSTNRRSTNSPRRSPLLSSCSFAPTTIHLVPRPTLHTCMYSRDSNPWRNPRPTRRTLRHHGPVFQHPRPNARSHRQMAQSQLRQPGSIDMAADLLLHLVRRCHYHGGYAVLA